MKNHSTKGIVQSLIYVQLVRVLFSGILFEYNSNFYVLTYVGIGIDVLLLGMIIVNTKFKISIEYKNLMFLMYVLFALLSTVWGEVGLYEQVMRLRYILLGYMFFYVVGRWIDEECLARIYALFFVAQLINLFLVYRQRFSHGLHPDFCNGIFGSYDYFNGAEGMFCLVLTIYSIVLYVDKKCSLKKMLYFVFSSCIICAIAEIKVYYVLFVMALVIIAFAKVKDRKVRMKFLASLLLVSIALVISYMILLKYFPNNLHTFFSIKDYVAYERFTEEHRETVGRLNSFSHIVNEDFNNSIIKILFGNGAGYSDYSYEFSKTFADFGLIGLIMLFAFFIILAYHNIVKGEKEKDPYKMVSGVWAILAIPIVVMWNSVFSGRMYLFFFLLGIGNASKNSLKHNHDNYS